MSLKWLPMSKHRKRALATNRARSSTPIVLLIHLEYFGYIIIGLNDFLANEIASEFYLCGYFLLTKAMEIPWSGIKAFYINDVYSLACSLPG